MAGRSGWPCASTLIRVPRWVVSDTPRIRLRSMSTCCHNFAHASPRLPSNTPGPARPSRAVWSNRPQAPPCPWRAGCPEDRTAAPACSGFRCRWPAGSFYRSSLSIRSICCSVIHIHGVMPLPSNSRSTHQPLTVGRPRRAAAARHQHLSMQAGTGGKAASGFSTLCKQPVPFIKAGCSSDARGPDNLLFRCQRVSLQPRRAWHNARIRGNSAAAPRANSKPRRVRRSSRSSRCSTSSLFGGPGQLGPQRIRTDHLTRRPLRQPAPATAATRGHRRPIKRAVAEPD
jgi:hypothetical protein